MDIGWTGGPGKAARPWGAVQLTPHNSASLGRDFQGLRIQLVRDGEESSQAQRPGLTVELLQEVRVWGEGASHRETQAGSHLPS